MDCTNPNCGAPIPDHVRNCVACGSDAGAPNVRAAENSSEIQVLDERYLDESEKAKENKYIKNFNSYEKAVEKSFAVIAMSVSRLLPVSSGHESLLSTFSLQLQAESRTPEDNRFDSLRESVEAAYFPNYSRYIRYAALSLDNEGHEAFGSCSVILKDSAIKDRSSVFEYPFFKFPELFNIQLGQKIPSGHRATWGNRNRLACVKAGDKVKDIAKFEDQANLLLPKSSDTVGDCIEVHIYGPINHYSIKEVAMRAESRRADKLIQEAITIKLSDVGVVVRTVK